MGANAASSSGQASYAETPYEDASWEVVGNPPATEEFVPMDIRVVPGQWTTTDPMFADYGGIAASTESVRWHLPEHVTYRRAPEGREAEAELEGKVTITETELEQLKQAAYQEGLSDGAREAEELNATERSALENRVNQIFHDLKNQLAENLLTVEKQALDLALRISKKIIEEAVEINPEYIVSLVRDSLGLAGTAHIKTVRVSPADLEFIQVLGIDQDFREKDGGWEFSADDSIKAGCIVETSAGEIDHQLDAAWERIREKVVRLVK